MHRGFYLLRSSAPYLSTGPPPYGAEYSSKESFGQNVWLNVSLIESITTENISRLGRSGGKSVSGLRILDFEGKKVDADDTCIVLACQVSSTS
jgi:hypothetical protein